MSAPTLREWAEQLRAGADRELGRGLTRELRRVSVDARRFAVGYATTRMKVRTGKLRQTIRSGTRVTPTGPEAWVGASTPYARIQELGGVVRPRRGQYLTIPLDPVLTAAGVTRQAARTMPGLFPYRAASGKLFLARLDGNGDLELVWLLVRSARIEPKKYLRDGLHDAAARIGTRLRDLLEQVVDARAGDSQGVARG